MINTIIGFYLGIAVCLLKSGIEDVAEGARYIRRKKALEADISDHNENIRLYGAFMSVEDAEKKKAELAMLKAELEKLEKE
jgi:uncharacterized protein YeeX (DUF496 family)